MANLVVWLDIPATDLNRAMEFYSNVLSVNIDRKDLPDTSIGVFEHHDHEVSCCLFTAKEPVRAGYGPLVYLSVEGRLDEAVGLVEKFGGKVLQSKHAIGPYGYRAIVIDSEGNRVALHSSR